MPDVSLKTTPQRTDAELRARTSFPDHGWCAATHPVRRKPGHQPIVSQQWNQFDYSRDRTWGFAASRIDHFLEQLNIREADIAGKLVLDAGCGNGVLSNAVAGLGASVVATDISDSVFAASRRFASTEALSFVQWP